MVHYSIIIFLNLQTDSLVRKVPYVFHSVACFPAVSCCSPLFLLLKCSGIVLYPFLNNVVLFQPTRHVPLHLRRKQRNDKPKPRHFEMMPPEGMLLPGQRQNVQVKFMPTEDVSVVLAILSPTHSFFY